jgi:DNA replication protein DnaC
LQFPAKPQGGHQKSSYALDETEIAARDARNTRLRSKRAYFPVVKSFDEFELSASSIRGFRPGPT